MEYSEHVLLVTAVSKAKGAPALPPPLGTPKVSQPNPTFFFSNVVAVEVVRFDVASSFHRGKKERKKEGLLHLEKRSSFLFPLSFLLQRSFLAASSLSQHLAPLPYFFPFYFFPLHLILKYNSKRSTVRGHKIFCCMALAFHAYCTVLTCTLGMYEYTQSSLLCEINFLGLHRKKVPGRNIFCC